jgi:IclR family KDG regulon transcriptional repressor
MSVRKSTGKAGKAPALSLAPAKATRSGAVNGKAAEEGERSAVKSLRKALGILRAVTEAGRDPTVAEVAIQTGLARATTHRLVQTLMTEGYLEQVDGRLSCGFSVLPLAASLLDHNRLRLEALPHLQTLAQKTMQRTNLGLLHQNRLLYLAGIEKPSLPTIYSRFGRMIPAHCCSLGKAILAQVSEDEVKALIAMQPLAAKTVNTITNMRAFMNELAAVRERGYAIDKAEHVLGTYCIAAPIFDAQRRPIAAIGLSGSALEPVLNEAPLVVHTAEVISHML